MFRVASLKSQQQQMAPLEVENSNHNNSSTIGIMNNGSSSSNNNEIYTSNNNTTRSKFVSCCCYTIKTINQFATLFLAIAVVLLYIQLQSVKSELAAEETKLDDLYEIVQDQQLNQQDLNNRVEQEHSLTIYQMAGTFTLLTCLLTAFHMTQHISNFHEPYIQRKIVTILWMSPIYSITSWLGLVFPSSDGYLAIIKDFYEAYVIYTFLSFLISVVGRGDREAAVNVLSHHADHLHPPTKCLNSCYHPPPDTNNVALASAVLMECQILAMQFVLVRPVTSILYFVSDIFVGEDIYDNDDPYAYFKTPDFYIDMIVNVSVFFAFNGLLKFYHLVRDEILWCKPFSKFLSIKSIVFLTFWQGLLISILVNVKYTGGVGSATTTGVVNTHNGPVSYATIVPTPVAGGGGIPMGHDNNITPAPSPIDEDGATIDLNDNSTRRFLRYRDFDYDNDVDDGNDINEIFSSSFRRFLGSSNNNDDDDQEESPNERAARIQNFLVCLEMLFFSIAHWCVFPAEEWAPDYRPKQSYAKPGMGLKDFASDISYIVEASSNARKYRRRFRKTKNSELVEESFSGGDSSNGDNPLDGEDGIVVEMNIIDRKQQQQTPESSFEIKDDPPSPIIS